MQPIIDKYEDANPNIDIQYVQKPFTQYDANTYTRIQQNTVDDTPAPDIIRINNTWLSKFQSSLSPLPSNVMSSTTYASKFYPTAVEDFTGTDGNIYAIPLEIDGLALFYNKQLLSKSGITEPPADWDTLIEASKKLTVTSNGKITQAGIALGTSKNIKHSADIFNLLLLQNGVDPIDVTNTEVTLTSTRAESAITFYTDFVETHKTWSPDLASDLEMFFSGNLAMMFAPSWRAFDIIQSAPTIEFGIAPVPQLPGNEPINYSMYWGEAVTATSDHPAEAWDFIEYMSQAENQKLFFSNASQVRAFGEPYSLKSLSPELEANTYLSAYAEMAPTMKSWKMGEQVFVEESINTAINDIIEGGAQPSSALLEAQTRINEKLAQSIK
jgi:multiple sugar transport system substrate-binding protein